jgi:RsiW-degrading membrane proteinase PrsW (M82 family)
MKRLWLVVLVAGLLIFGILDLFIRASGNTGFLPALLWVGAFTIPISLVVYFYEHVRDHDISKPLLTVCFAFGGALGLTAAGLIEFSTLRTLNFGALVAVGFIEEASKLIFPVFMYWAWRNRHETDGLLFGVAAGMGFAALETWGYGSLAFIQSRGSIGDVEQTLLLRGLLSPAGHVAWTGLVCAVLWKERQKAGQAVINLAVITAFLAAVCLHTAWDVINTVSMPALVAYVGMVVIASLSLFLLIQRYREARDDLPSSPPPASVSYFTDKI